MPDVDWEALGRTFMPDLDKSLAAKMVMSGSSVWVEPPTPPKSLDAQVVANQHELAESVRTLLGFSRLIEEANATLNERLSNQATEVRKHRERLSNRATLVDWLDGQWWREVPDFIKSPEDRRVWLESCYEVDQHLGESTVPSESENLMAWLNVMHPKPPRPLAWRAWR